MIYVSQVAVFMFKSKQLHIKVHSIYGVVYLFHKIYKSTELFHFDDMRTQRDCPRASLAVWG